MRQASHQLSFETTVKGLYEVTEPIVNRLADQAMAEGLLTVFMRHTSASLIIQKNADPDVIRDLDTFFAWLAPEDPGIYRHRSEGPDDIRRGILKGSDTVDHMVAVDCLDRCNVGGG